MTSMFEPAGGLKLSLGRFVQHLFSDLLLPLPFRALLPLCPTTRCILFQLPPPDLFMDVL